MKSLEHTHPAAEALLKQLVNLIIVTGGSNTKLNDTLSIRHLFFQGRILKSTHGILTIINDQLLVYGANDLNRENLLGEPQRTNAINQILLSIPRESFLAISSNANKSSEIGKPIYILKSDTYTISFASDLSVKEVVKDGAVVIDEKEKNCALQNALATIYPEINETYLTAEEMLYPDSEQRPRM